MRICQLSLCYENESFIQLSDNENGSPAKLRTQDAMTHFFLYTPPRSFPNLLL